MDSNIIKNFKSNIGKIYFINNTFRIFCNCGTTSNNIKIFTMHFLQDHLNLNKQSIKVLDELLINKANQIDDSSELNEEDPIAIDDKNKIGEIYFINKTFRIFCNCEIIFNNIKMFTRHFLQDHLNLNNQSTEVLDKLIYKGNQIDESSELNDENNVNNEFNLKENVDSDNLRDPFDASEDFSESVYNENSVSDSETSNFKIIILENDNFQINNEAISTKESLKDETDNVNGNEGDDGILISDEKKIDCIKNAKGENEGEPKKKTWNCDLCSETFDEQETFVKHKLDIHNEILNCKFCGKFFSTVKNLQHHELRWHSDSIAKYKCKWCDRMYIRREQCTYHENTNHDSSGKKVLRKYKNTKNHICEKCGEGFVLPVKLREHVRLQHTGERPLKCDLCSESFATKRQLLKHNYSHMEEPPYKCDYCDEGFFIKSKLNLHEIIHHMGSNKVECKLCEKKYRSSYHLNRHMRRIHKITKYNK